MAPPRLEVEATPSDPVPEDSTTLETFSLVTAREGESPL